MRHYASLAVAAAILLAGCTVEVKEAEPKGGCLYHCDAKACCDNNVTKAWCDQHAGTWSDSLKSCP